MSRRSESVAPSLFPFLAVLLCTMGALVLMLLLLVVGAQSSAKEVADKVEDEFQWEQDKLQTVRNNLSKKYEDAKVEIENKKLHLQNIEQHIFELKEELEQLERTSLAAENKQGTEKESQKLRDAEREALEKQLAEAKKTLETKLKDPKGDKPIFAIIPYDGPNGTHRRPIYLECNAKGLVVQPEGVVLTPTDLSPPYGPGNPLDAVLRTIRAEFPSRDGSVDSNPYPLIVVRPSGIKHYMMARAAMAGWDDQFGYELIGEDLELAFPASTSNLQKKIVSTIDAARQRQAALVLSMPQHYDASQLEFYGSSGGGTSEDISGVFEGVGGGGSTGSAGTGNSGYSSRGSGGKRGGMSLIGTPGGASGAAAPGGSGNSNDPPSLTQSLAQSSSGSKAGQSWTFGQSAAQQTNGSTAGPTGDRNNPSMSADPTGSSSGSGQMSFFGGGSNEEVAGFSSRKSAGSSGVGGVGGPGAIGGNSPDGENFSNSAIADSKAGGGGFNSTASESGSSSRSNSGGSPSNSSSSGSPSSGSAGGGASSMASNPMASNSPGSSSSVPPGFSGDPSQQQGEMQNVGMNFDMSRRSNETKSVAQTKGRGWAWRDGNRSQTAIVRAIWLQCYKDRWLIRPDKGSNGSIKTIKLEGSPVQRAERLAAAVHQRVESWGVALAGGHWAPVVHVEVASDAEDQFKQLQKLMEGSGIEIVRKGTIAPQVFRQ